MTSAYTTGVMTPAELKRLRATNLAATHRILTRTTQTMREAELQQEVQDLCDRLGIPWCHPVTFRGIPRGWPGMVIITPRRVLWRELKTQFGKLSPEQETLGRTLRQAGESWGTWRPRDLTSGAIERELTDLVAVQGELWAG